MSMLPNTVGVGYFDAPFSYVRAILGEPIYKKSYQGHDYGGYKFKGLARILASVS